MFIVKLTVDERHVAAGIRINATSLKLLLRQWSVGVTVIDGEGLEWSLTVTVAVGVVDDETSADGVAVLLKLTDAVVCVSIEGVIVIVVVGVASAGTVRVLVVR